MILPSSKANAIVIRNIIIIFCVFAAVSVSAADSVSPLPPLPFWRAKPKVFAKITDERQIVVSVNAEKRGSKSVLLMDGGGLVSAPAETSFAEAQKYQNLKELSDDIVEVKTGPAADDVFIHTQAFNYHARMMMKVTTETVAVAAKKTVTETKSSPQAATATVESQHLRFTVVDGNFKGMTGEFNFSPYKSKTILGFHAEYEYDVLPMPKFFVEFGLEVVLQRVASRMRSYIEEIVKQQAIEKQTPKK
jgi:Polyketide cyclase / dehydrase and lipid transport